MKLPLVTAFIDFKKAFDFIKQLTFLGTMGTQTQLLGAIRTMSFFYCGRPSGHESDSPSSIQALSCSHSKWWILCWCWFLLQSSVSCPQCQIEATTITGEEVGLIISLKTFNLWPLPAMRIGGNGIRLVSDYFCYVSVMYLLFVFDRGEFCEFAVGFNWGYMCCLRKMCMCAVNPVEVQVNLVIVLLKKKKVITF